jgi:hypothetical protein
LAFDLIPAAASAHREVFARRGLFYASPPPLPRLERIGAALDWLQ